MHIFEASGGAHTVNPLREPGVSLSGLLLDLGGGIQQGGRSVSDRNPGVASLVRTPLKKLDVLFSSFNSDWNNTVTQYIIKNFFRYIIYFIAKKLWKCLASYNDVCAPSGPCFLLKLCFTQNPTID